MAILDLADLDKEMLRLKNMEEWFRMHKTPLTSVPITPHFLRLLLMECINRRQREEKPKTG